MKIADVENPPEKESVKKDNNKEDYHQDDEQGTINGVGCVNGCIRDSHFCITFLTFAMVTIPILWILNVLPTLVFGIAEGIVGVIYLILCLTSHTFQYLRNVVTAEDIMMYMDRMYKMKPEIVWTINCWHNETRTRIVTRDGKRETKTYQEKVCTHSARGKLDFVGWQDISAPLRMSEIENYTMTKVSVKKKWVGDAGALAQKREFIRQNDRDTYYDFSEEFILQGYRPRFLGFLDLDEVPYFAHWTWFVLSHLTVVFGFPYRMWLSSKTGKVRTAITKQVWTSPKNMPETLQ